MLDVSVSDGYLCIVLSPLHTVIHLISASHVALFDYPSERCIFWKYGVVLLVCFDTSVSSFKYISRFQQLPPL